MLITNLAVFKFEEGEMRLVELMPGATIEEVERKTEATFVNCIGKENREEA